MQSFWSDKRVLVTGHTGFKGAWLCQWLSQLGAKVAGISLAPATEPSLFELLQLESKVKHHLVDVRNRQAMTEVFNAFKPEVVFHLAAQAIVLESYRAPAETFDTNVMGTVNLLELVRATPSVRSVVVITTDKVYRPSIEGKAHVESEPLGGHDPYSASKACTELVVSSYRDSFLNTPESPLMASVRAGNVIGGGDFADDRLIPDVCRAWSQQKKVAIRNPSSIRPWQHVLDALNVYLKLAEGLFNNQTKLAVSWNIGPESHDMWPVSRIIEQMSAHWPDASGVEFGEAIYHENPCLKLDSSALRSELGWQPVWPLAKALQHTTCWYNVWASASSPQALVDLSNEQLQQFMVAAGRGE